MTHNSKSGVAHFAADDEESCLEDVRYLMSFLPQNNLELPAADGDRATTPTARTRSSTTSSRTTRTSRTTCATWCT
jgi:acetyl-CoA carboxylase carboxyltransferase component